MSRKYSEAEEYAAWLKLPAFTRIDWERQMEKERQFHSEERATAAKYPRMYSQIYNKFMKLDRVFDLKDIEIIEDLNTHNLVCRVEIKCSSIEYYTTQFFHILWYGEESLDHYLQDTVRVFSEMILQG